MHPSAWEIYVDAFREATRQFVGPATALIDEVGIVGAAGSNERRNGRLLIMDDSALPVLRELGDPRASMVTVLPDAIGCVEHMSGLCGYLAEGATAMVARDLAAVPSVGLHGALALRAARKGATGDDVELDRAAAACVLADPSAADVPLDDFISYLVSIPNAEFFTAVDERGAVRATAGVAVFGADARVFFVSTDPGWRGRGIATAMTATALLSARARGASRAALDASSAARSIYERLGFEAVAELTMFAHLT